MGQVAGTNPMFGYIRHSQAEELVFGQPTTGAESDLKQATSLARRMVGVWGMSAELGPVSYGLGETDPFLGRELALPREYAEATAAALDQAVRSVIEEAYRRARSTLEAHRPALERLAEELIAHETVDGQRLDAILQAAGIAGPRTNGLLTAAPRPGSSSA